MALWKPFGKKETSPAESGTPAQSETPEASVDPDSGNTAAAESRFAELPTAESASIPPGSLPPSPASEETPADRPAKTMGMFGRFKSALKKTVEVLNTDIRDLVKEGRLVDDQFLDELFADLVKTDMGVGPAGKIRDGIQSEFRGRRLFMSDLANSAKRTITEIMRQDSA